jgi:membrane associated rhomboid family serine protease
VLTATAFAIAVAAAVLQYAVPDVVPWLQRDPAALSQGQWWRLATPLLVQTLGWYQVAANLITLAIIGVVSEWVLGRWRWALLFVGGTVGGQLAAYAWREPGGGDSIAICGLAGGVVIAASVARAPGWRFANEAVISYIAALTGWGFGGILAAGLACIAVAVGLRGLARLGVPNVERGALAGVVVCALALVAAQDLHGVSLTAGMALMTVVAATERVVHGRPRAARGLHHW